MEKIVYQKMFENEDRFWWHQGMKKIVVSLLERYLPERKGLIILDIGCGTGGMFSTLKKYGQVWGIDKSAEAVAYAKRRNIAEEIILGEASRMPFSDKTFDLICCFDVLYHKWVENDDKVLKEIYRILAPGGLVIIREAAYDWLRSQHDEIVWTKHRYNKTELKNKLEQAGFKVKKCSFANFFLFPIALVKRLSEKIVREKSHSEKVFYINPIINPIFKLFLYFEAILIKYINFPFGLSIICLAKK